MSSASPPPTGSGVSRPLLAVLALLSAVAPFATDMYLPTFTDMAADLQTGASSVQLTLTAFFVGIATGQLVIGPLSDRFGRRRPILLATTVAVAACVACAVAPNVWSLIVFRFAHGFAGAAGVVVARAVAADRTSGRETARLFSLLAAIGGVAPVVAPLAGGLLAAAGWRSVFWVLAAISALMLLGAVLVVPETLPPERRHGGGIAATGRAARRLLADRGYLGYTFAFGFGFAGLMGYISASPFVVQNVLGLSTTAYTVTFAVNALGLTAASVAGARLLRRFSPERLLRVAQGAVLLLSAVLLATLAAGLPAVAVLPVLFLTVSCFSLVMGNSSALAVGRAPYATGTAAAVLGALQFAFGALVAPLVGMGGEGTALPMGVTLVVSAVLGIGAHLVAAKAAPAAPPAPDAASVAKAPSTVSPSP